MTKSVGERIKELRLQRRLTQDALAVRVGVSRQTISNWEVSRTSVSTADLAAIAEGLGVSQTDLVDPESQPPNPDVRPRGRSSEDRNVTGRLDEVRNPGVKPLPIYRWGAMGDPRDEFSAPYPDRLEHPPLGREHLVGLNGFAVEVRGTSMVGRDLQDGDVCWINPDRAYRLGDLVLALVTDGDGDAGMVIKTYAHTDVGYGLVSETDSGRSTVVCREFKIIGPVVLVQRVFPPR